MVVHVSLYQLYQLYQIYQLLANACIAACRVVSYPCVGVRPS